MFRKKQISNLLLLILIFSCSKEINNKNLSDKFEKSVTPTQLNVLPEIKFELDSLNKRVKLIIINLSNEDIYIPIDDWYFYELLHDKINWWVTNIVNNVFYFSNNSEFPFDGQIDMNILTPIRDSTLKILKLNPNKLCSINIKFKENSKFKKKVLNKKYLHLKLFLFNKNNVDTLINKINYSNIYKRINLITENKYNLIYDRDTTLNYVIEDIKFHEIFSANAYYYLVSKDSTLKIRDNFNEW